MKYKKTIFKKETEIYLNSQRPKNSKEFCETCNAVTLQRTVELPGKIGFFTKSAYASRECLNCGKKLHAHEGEMWGD